MKKVFKIIRNIIFGIFLVAYLSVIICVSTLVLNRNDYGYTEFGDKALLDIKEDTNNYVKGQLVIVEKRVIDKLKVGDEIFVYQTNQQEKTVKVVSSTIKDVKAEETTPYITLSSDDTSWGQDYIAGEKVKVYNSLGSIVTFAESKWIFFAIFIVPCFFILLYEIYSVIVVIKFDGEEVVLDGPAAAAQGGQQAGVDNVNVVMDQNNMNVLMQQINNLQNQLNMVNQPGVQPQANAVPQQTVGVTPPPQVQADVVAQPTIQPQSVGAPVNTVQSQVVTPNANVVQPSQVQSTPASQPTIQPQTVDANTNVVQSPQLQQAVSQPVIQPQTVVENVAQPQLQSSTVQSQSTPVVNNQPIITSDKPSITNVISDSGN